MIGYITLGTNDMKRSAAFYDKLLAEVGAKRMMESRTRSSCGATARRRRRCL